MDKFFASESSLIESLSEFMRKLNDEVSALVVVEGLRDAKALRDAGYDGELFMLCHKNNILSLEETASRFQKIILLLDNDREGQKLSARTKKILGGKVRIDTFYQRELLPASKGKIRHVEELAPYALRLSRHV
ncbi:MAG TPA: toprim domain-containing protein [Nitrososphaerales archaeon]|nr:toprim domain-containing protein [Nitrososphaerales archaeon]